MPKRFEHCFLDWTSIPYEIGFAIINWIYTNDTPVRLRNDNLSEKDTNENDSFVLTLMKSAKSFGLQDLMNRCEESLVARVQVIENLRIHTMPAFTGIPNIFTNNFDTSFTIIITFPRYETVYVTILLRKS